MSAFVAIFAWFLMGTPAIQHGEILSGIQLAVIVMAGTSGEKIVGILSEGGSEIAKSWIKKLSASIDTKESQTK